MNEDARLQGLNKLLTVIYGAPTELATMIDDLGFDLEQARMLREQCLPSVAVQFIEVVRRKLTSGERDLWFRLLSRRYGLDGEPPVSLEEAAAVLEVDAGYASQAQSDALEKCRYKTTQQEFQRELRAIALSELSKGGATPAREQVVEKLNRLADLRAAVDMTRMDFEAKRTEVLKKVQAELDALESEYQPLLDAAEENASALEAEIKNDVLLTGETISTDVFQAVYMKGRVSWDTEGITRYAQAHPDVLRFRREGQPAVQLRTVGR